MSFAVYVASEFLRSLVDSAKGLRSFAPFVVGAFEYLGGDLTFFGTCNIHAAAT